MFGLQKIAAVVCPLVHLEHAGFRFRAQSINQHAIRTAHFQYPPVFNLYNHVCRMRATAIQK